MGVFNIFKKIFVNDNENIKKENKKLYLNEYMESRIFLRN